MAALITIYICIGMLIALLLFLGLIEAVARRSNPVEHAMLALAQRYPVRCIAAVSMLWLPVLVASCATRSR